MIEFKPGSEHIATLPITVAPAGLACQVELWLSPDGETKSASSGLVPFTSTGSQEQLSLTVTMPSTEATYHVLADIYCAGNLIASYQALEDVSIVSPMPSVAIDQIFVCTRGYPYKDTSDDGIYVRVANLGNTEVSAVLNVYDWQARWGQPVGDDRRWSEAFTIPAGGTFLYTHTISHVNNDPTYFRAELLVNDVLVDEVPIFYVIPGKDYTGSEKIAVGECTNKAPGHFVLWYSQYSECDNWHGRYRTPPTIEGDAVHDGGLCGPSTLYKCRTPSGDYWPAVFFPVFDPGILSGHTYEGYISGGPANREVWFEFTAA